MADYALPDSCEGVSRELFEDIVQTADGLLGEHPGHGRILSGEALHPRDVHEVHRAVRQCLHEDRRRTRDERGRTEQVAAPNVADRDLAAVAREHVHAEQPSDEYPEALCIRLFVDGHAHGNVELPAGGRETLHRLDGK
jgi:hypothetical protein